MRIVQQVYAEPLTARAFADFGEVVEAAGDFELINNGTARRYADRATIDTATDGGRPRISICRAAPGMLPMPIRMLERHPLSSQCFVPLARQPFLVVVAPAGDRIDPVSIRAYLTGAGQGVNYRRGTWHHPLIALGESGDFLVIDRGGAGGNCDEFSLGDREIVVCLPEQRVSG